MPCTVCLLRYSHVRENPITVKVFSSAAFDFMIFVCFSVASKPFKLAYPFEDGGSSPSGDLSHEHVGKHTFFLHTLHPKRDRVS